MLFTNLEPEFGGGGLQGLRLMRSLTETGCAVMALTSRPPALAAPAREYGYGGVIERLLAPASPRLRYRVFGLRAAVWLWRRRRDWDLLHIHGFGLFAGPAVRLARALGRPVLIKSTVLTGAHPLLANASRGGVSDWLLGAYEEADALIALSGAIEEQLRQEVAVRDVVRRIPNGVDTELFRPATGPEEVAAQRTAFGLAPDVPVVLTCGRLESRKNAVSLVRAAGELPRTPLQLVLAGPAGADPDYDASLAAAIAALPDGIEVVRTGKLEPPRVAELMRAADVFVLPSRAEGMPNSLLEAMASGLACVASRIPGSSDILDAGGGLLVELDDDSELAAALARLLEGEDVRSRLGRAARERIESEYSSRQVAGLYRELYRELFSKTSATVSASTR